MDLSDMLDMSGYDFGYDFGYGKSNFENLVFQQKVARANRAAVANAARSAENIWCYILFSPGVVASYT